MQVFTTKFMFDNQNKGGCAKLTAIIKNELRVRNQRNVSK